MAFDKLKISTVEDVKKRAEKDQCSEEVATGAIMQELQALVEAGEEGNGVITRFYASMITAKNQSPENMRPSDMDADQRDPPPCH